MKKVSAYARVKQKTILTYIHMSKNPPTLREIQADCGISSTSVVNFYVNRMVANGLLERQSHKARTLKLTPQGLAFLGVKMEACPCCGQPMPSKLIVAKLPIFPQQILA